MKIDLKTVQSSIAAVQEKWEAIPQMQNERLIRSMRRRMVTCITVNGDHTTNNPNIYSNIDIILGGAFLLTPSKYYYYYSVQSDILLDTHSGYIYQCYDIIVTLRVIYI